MIKTQNNRRSRKARMRLGTIRPRTIQNFASTNIVVSQGITTGALGDTSLNINLRDLMTLSDDFNNFKNNYMRVWVTGFTIIFTPYVDYTTNPWSPLVVANTSNSTLQTVDSLLNVKGAIMLQHNKSKTHNFASLNLEVVPQNFDLFSTEINRLGYLQIRTVKNSHVNKDLYFAKVIFHCNMYDRK